MGRLIYTAIASLDGYIEDADGSFEWAVPDDEVHRFLNDLERPIRTHLYGRRMYETMAVWQDIVAGPDVQPAEVEYSELWRGLDKVVYSTSLDEVWTARTRLERAFDPAEVRRLVDAAEGDVSISGPGVAQHAFAASLVDEVHLFLFPVIVGGGKPALPDGVRVELELLAERRFGNGVVHLHHAVR